MSTTTTATLKSLIEQHNVRAAAEYTGSHNEVYETPSGSKGFISQDDWKVTLRMHGRRLTVDFHMGSGHNGAEPTAYDVLYCLISDALGFQYASDFEDWASEYGFDSDSRKAEATYHQVMKAAAKLQRFLGEYADTFMRSELD